MTQTTQSPSPGTQSPSGGGAPAPIIPPYYLLILSLIGFAIAAGVAFTQPDFNVVGFGGLAFGLLGLLAWALLAPDQAWALVRGRTARYGGTSVLVTALLIAFLIGVYSVARGANIRIDLTQRNDFSLTPESRAAMIALGADPSIPPVEIIAFYGGGQAARRDQDRPLFEDYARSSGGKVGFRFVDPDREPQIARLFNVTASGQLVVAPLTPDGEYDVANTERVAFFDQGQLTNAILKVASQGVFNAFFLNVQDGSSDQMSLLKQTLRDTFAWNVQETSLIALSSPDANPRLNDPNADGEVIVIPGGSAPLSEQELTLLRDYLDAGGSVVVFAAPPVNEQQTSLAADAAFNEYLFAAFGLRFEPTVVLDRTQAFQSALIPVTTDLDPTAFITTTDIPRSGGAFAFEVPMSITVTDTPPANVSVTPLARTSANAYAKRDLAAVISGDVDRAEDDAAGPFVLAAQSENATTGGRVVLIASDAVGIDSYTLIGNLYNFNLSVNSLVWATDFFDFFIQINVTQRQRPQDTPIFADQQTLRSINFWTLIALPFGVLLVGVYVWYSGRERARKS